MSVMTPVAVVTGGASGIGEACARRFSKEGYSIAILDVEVARAAEVAKGIEESGGVAVDFQCDVTNAKSLDDLARRIETEILAVELGRFGVRVNGVAPTYVLTPALKARIDAGERDPQTILHAGALEMFVEPHQVAAVAAFLCSEQAAAITGVMLPVDAGWGAAVAYKSYAGGVPWEN